MVDGPPLGFLGDPTIHPRIASSLLVAAKGEVALTTMCHALLFGDFPGARIGKALADRWVDGLRSHLRLVASEPAAQVPEDVVPQADRLPLAELSREANRAEDDFQILAQRSREAGTPFFPGLP